MRSRLLFYSASLAAAIVLGGVVLGEGALHIQPSMRAPPDEPLAAELAEQTDASHFNLEVTAADDVVLRATLFRPARWNGSAVALLHGVAASRDGMLSYARFLLDAGYVAILPDSRGHGSSGGDVVSYGVRERTDVVRWVDWLNEHEHPRAIYGLGESMGAAVLLQSLAVEQRFSAVVAECSFSDFRHVAADRIAQQAHIPQPWAFRPFVESGLLYARLRYGLRLDDASPVSALAHTRTPVLLIHGMIDDNIPSEHSRRLLAASPAGTKLWQPPNAGHVGAITADPAGFHRAVLDWYSQHRAATGE